MAVVMTPTTQHPDHLAHVRERLHALYDEACGTEEVDRAIDQAAHRLADAPVDAFVPSSSNAPPAPTSPPPPAPPPPPTPESPTPWAAAHGVVDVAFRSGYVDVLHAGAEGDPWPAAL
jgi:hypothetical protein